MNGRAILIGFVAAVAVAVSGIAASDAFAEPEIDLQLRGVVADSGDVFLNGPYDVKVFTYNGRIYAVVAGSEEGAHLLDITNPASINPLNNGGHGQRNVQPIPSTNTARMQAIAVYTANDGQPYFIATWTVSNALQAFKIAKAGDTDGAGGAIKQVGTLVNRPAPLSDNRLGGASDLIIYSVGNKHYAAVTAEGADGLVLVDVTDPNALAGKIVGQITDGGNLELDGPSGVEHYQTNNRHYAVVVSSVDDGMQIVDITNPASPTAAGHLSDDSSTLLDGAEGVAIYSVGGRTYAVVAATIDDGIQIVDITDPANIFPTGKLGDAGSLLLDRVHDVAIHTIGDRHYAVVTSINEHGIQVVDVTNPYNPVPKATIADGTTLRGATGVDTFSIGNRHYAVVTGQDRDRVQIVEMTAVNADAGDGLSVDAGRTVVLAGSGSVSSGATPTYQWTQTGGTTVTLNAPTALRTTFTAPTTPSTLIFQLAATHGGATSTDIVTVSVAPDAVGSPDKTAVDLALRDSVADNANTYLAYATDVKVFEHNGKIYAVVASNGDSIHLLDITDPANIDELRHPAAQPNTGPNNHNSAAGGESAVPYVAMDGNLYILLSWGSSDALQSFYIHSNGRLDELAATVDNSKMDHAADLIIYTLQTRCDSTPGTALIVSQGTSGKTQCVAPKIIGYTENRVVEPGDLVARQYAAVIGHLSHSIRIVDVTDPRDLGMPALRGEITDDTSTLLRGPIDIAHYQTNNRHYAVVAASQEDGIQIVDITNPNSPTAAGKLEDTDDLEMRGADGVAVYSVGGRTYAVVTGNSEDGIQIVDITDPHNIFPTGNLADTGMLELDNPRGVAVHTIGDRYYAVVAASHDDGIEAVDVTDPYNPVPKGRVGDTTGAVELDGATGVDTFSIGNRHYVVVASSDDHGVQIAEMAVLTADAGGDRVIPGRTAQIPLDGSASTVSSGDSPTYQWTQTGGPPVTLSVPTIAIPNFAPPAPPQILSFLLTVSHGNARAVDTVTVTLEGNPSTDVASFGGQIVSETIDVVDVPHNNGTAGTSKYISMHFAGEGESQTFTYRLLEAPSGTVTVSFMTLVQTGHDDAVYTWDWQAVSVSPRTLTFTPSNWYTPQVVTLTSQTDGDNTSEQVIIAIVSSAPGSYSGIHVTVDDPRPLGTSGTSGGPVFESAQSPVITLSGPYIMDVQLNSVWTDPGYTATDSDGNDITASVTVTGTVDTATAATYLLYYQVADAYGTPATPQTRTVHVIAPEPQQLTQQPQPQPQQTQEPQPEPEPEPEQEPTQEPQQEPEQEPTQEPEQEPEQTQEPEQEPEQTQEPEQEPEQTQEPEQEPEGTESDQQPTCDIPAIVRQYDADGSCKIEQSEWLVAVADYAADPPKLTTPQIQQIAAHRG